LTSLRVATSRVILDSVNAVTQILSAIDQGDPAASEQLLPLVYQELRRLAGEFMVREKPGQTLQATALVHEAYLRLVGGDTPRDWNGRGHFFAAAAEAMRRILIESARRKSAQKRGGGQFHRVDYRESELPGSSGADELLLLDDALGELAAEAPDAADVAKLRLFAGMPMEEAAAALGVSRATAFRSWTYARAWLNERLQPQAD